MHKIALSLGLLIAASMPAFAADFRSPILGPDGKTVPLCTDKTPECEAPLTLGIVASNALFAPEAPASDGLGRPTAVGADEKVKRAALALRIAGAGQLDLTAEETAMAKQAIGRIYAPLVVYRAWALLDPASVPKP